MRRQHPVFIKNDLSSFFLFLSPFFAINVISLVYTWNRFSTLNELNILVWILGSVYLFSITDRKEALLKALVIGAALSAICAVVQSKVLFPNLIEVFQGGRYAEITRGQAIPFSSFLYHNVFGGYMCFVLPLAIYFGVYQGKWLYKIVTPCIIAGIILSTSRIAMGISFLFVLCFIAAMIKRRDIRGILTVMAITAVGIAIVFTLLHTGKGGEFRGLTAELGKKAQITKSEVTTLNTRTEIWDNGIKAFVAKPIIGYGAGAFEYGYRKYFDGGIYTRYAHSTLLKIGVELGLIGILCFLFYIAGFFSCLRGRLKEPENLFVLASTGCGFLFGLLDFSFDMPAHIITFFVLSSVVFIKDDKLVKNQKTVTPVKTGVQNQLNLLDVACASEDTCFRRNDKKAAEESKARVAAGFSLHIVSYIIVACLLGSFLFTVKANLSGKSIENGIACEDNGFIFNAYLSYIDAIYDMPIDNDGYIKVVGVLKRLYEGEADPGKKENIKNSLKMYLNKIEKKGDLDSGLFFVAGMSYTTLRETNKAEGYLLKAISYYPSSAYYIYEIVRFYVNNNEPEKAKQWAHAVDPYLDKYRTSRNPKGFYVYKIRDMEAGMEYKQGNIAAASSIAKNNLRDAKEERFVISSIRLGENVSKTSMVNYLKTKYEYYENLSTGK